jgi:hypothetical protein
VSTCSEQSSIHALEKDRLSYIRFAANELASALVQMSDRNLANLNRN